MEVRPSYSNKIASDILEKISMHYNIPVDKIQGKSRAGHIVYVRHLFIYWASQHFLRFKPSRLCELLHRDRTSIYDAVVSFRNRIETNSPLPYQLKKNNFTTPDDYRQILTVLQN